MKKLLLPIISLLALTSCSNYDYIGTNVYLRNETFAVIYCKIGDNEFSDEPSSCSSDFKPFSQFDPKNVISINCIDLTNYDITSISHLHYHVVYRL